MKFQIITDIALKCPADIISNVKSHFNKRSLAGSSVPHNIQLQVYYTQISILMHRHEIGTSKSCTYVFKQSRCSSAHWNKIQNIQKANILLASSDSYPQCWLLQKSFPSSKQVPISWKVTSFPCYLSGLLTTQPLWLGWLMGVKL